MRRKHIVTVPAPPIGNYPKLPPKATADTAPTNPHTVGTPDWYRWDWQHRITPIAEAQAAAAAAQAATGPERALESLFAPPPRSPRRGGKKPQKHSQLDEAIKRESGNKRNSTPVDTDRPRSRRPQVPLAYATYQRIIPADRECNHVPVSSLAYADTPEYNEACQEWHHQHDKQAANDKQGGEYSPAYAVLCDALEIANFTPLAATNSPLTAYSVLVSALETVRQGDTPDPRTPHARRYSRRWYND